VTERFVVFVTVAVNSCVEPSVTEAVVGETLTPIVGGGGGAGGDVTPHDVSSNMQITEKITNMMPMRRIGGLPVFARRRDLRVLVTPSHKARGWPVFRDGTFRLIIAGQNTRQRVGKTL
jgi:hypothetical protein